MCMLLNSHTCCSTATACGCYTAANDTVRQAIAHMHAYSRVCVYEAMTSRLSFGYLVSQRSAHESERAWLRYRYQKWTTMIITLRSTLTSARMRRSTEVLRPYLVMSCLAKHTTWESISSATECGQYTLHVAYHYVSTCTVTTRMHMYSHNNIVDYTALTPLLITDELLWLLLNMQLYDLLLQLHIYQLLLTSSMSLSYSDWNAALMSDAIRLTCSVTMTTESIQMHRVHAEQLFRISSCRASTANADCHKALLWQQTSMCDYIYIRQQQMD